MMKKNSNINVANKLYISRKFIFSSVLIVMLFILLFNVICSNIISYADDDTKTITVTIKWNDENSTSLRPSNVTLHLLNTTTSEEQLSNNNNWTKNGNTWTYEFTVPDNTDEYEVWENDIPYYRSSTATNGNRYKIITKTSLPAPGYSTVAYSSEARNKATITNICFKTPITITKIWNDESYSNNRPENITVYLTKTSSTLLEGQALNAKMKTLANNTNTVYDRDQTTVKSIIKATYEQYMAKKATIDQDPAKYEIQSSGLPVYMWYQANDSTYGNTLYFYSEADNIYMNPTSDYAFCRLTALTNISGLSEFNTTYVTNMEGMFWKTTSLQDISPLENWNVSNVENMYRMFGRLVSSSYESMKIASVEPLQNWDISNVINMANMFDGNSNLRDISAISNWDVSCLQSMRQMFSHTGIRSFNPLVNWNIVSILNSSNGSSASGLYMMFAQSTGTSTNGNHSNVPIFTVRPGTWNNNNEVYRTSTTSTPVYSIYHSISNPELDLISSLDSGWIKNGNVWTYTFIVNNDGSKYKVWEDTTRDDFPRNYESSADNTTEHPAIYVENNAATITNTNTKRYITVTKQWNDDNNSYNARPNNIKLHLIKEGTDIQSDDNNWTKNGNTWTYVFEVSDSDEYSVWEEPVSHYTTNAMQSSPIPITNNSATITNNINTSDITLVKKVTGNLAKTDKDFEFEITIYDDNNTALPGNITIERNCQPSEISNGSKINLKHNEQIIIKNVISGYKYTIIETDTDYTEYFKIDKTDELDESQKVVVSQTTGTTINNQTLNENQTVTFINNKDSIPSTMVNTYIKPYINITILSILFIIIIFKKDYIEKILNKEIILITSKFKK